jgi:thioredoxin reductase (NADPH)
VVGGGPAGLSAAVYMGRFRWRTLVLDDETGRWTYGQRNDNYLGFVRGVSARRLHTLGQAQARRFGVTFRQGCVERVEATAAGFRLSGKGGPWQARTVIWATGVADRWPSFPSARRLVGRHLFWCIVCDGWRARERRVLVLGDDDKAARTTLQFLTYTRRLTLLVDPERGRLSSRARAKLAADGIPVLRGRVRRARLDQNGLEGVTLADGRTLDVDLIFSLYGSVPRTKELKGLDVGLASNGHVRADAKGFTSLPRFFAAGDVTNRHAHQVVSAVHEGAEAAMAANHVLYPPSQRL